MKKQGLLIAAVAAAALLIAAPASAHNLDKKTAGQAAKTIAKRECRDTRDCTAYDWGDCVKKNSHKWNCQTLLQLEDSSGVRICSATTRIELDENSFDIFYNVGRYHCRRV